MIAINSRARDWQVLNWASRCDREVFEESAWAHEMPVVRAYQILNRLLDDPKAYQRDARTIDFWRGVRDGAREIRNAA